MRCVYQLHCQPFHSAHREQLLSQESLETLPQDTGPVKIHATLLNTRYRKRQQTPQPGVSQQQQQQRIPFDGRPLLAAMGGVEFGSLDVTELHLSRRGEYHKDTGYYVCEASVPLAKCAA
eukprot:355039-Chlamydomonas_euryale.AAC.2